MNEQKDPANENANEAVSPEAESVLEPAEEVGPDAPSPDEKLVAENAELRDRMLRLGAEMDNLRKRTEREVKDAKAYAVTGFARDMLSVADNMRRAIDAVPEEERQTVASLLEGVEMTEREFLKTLERHGVKKLEPQGEKFDPNVHQAMFEVEDPSVPHGSVVQVLQSGYVIGERVLRPAMVGVSKGGPKGTGGAGRGEDQAEQQANPTLDRRA